MDNITLAWLGIILLLVISAFFSGSETALTAASKARLHSLMLKGSRRAALVTQLREKKEKLIGGILLGNNLVNILSSALATHVLVKTFGEAGVVYATLIMTLLVLIFAEVLPKTYAIYNAERVALAVSWPMRFIIALFAPVTTAIQVIVRSVLRLIGAGIPDENEEDTEEELRGAIDLHAAREEGDQEETRQERAMLRSILDLSDVAVGEIMTHRSSIEALDIDQPISDLISTAANSAYTRLPLWKENPDNIIGILHTKTLLKCVHQAQDQLTRDQIISAALPVWYTPESTSLGEQLEAFQLRRAHMALVVDEYGDFLGLVTLEDILEEIVGDISDEHDLTVPGVTFLDDGALLVDGTVTLRDLNREFDWSLPDDSAATIAGLLLYETRQIPEINQVFRFYGFRFEVIGRKKHQITGIRIVPPKPVMKTALSTAMQPAAAQKINPVAPK